LREVLVDRPRQEEDNDDGCRDPHGPVEIGVAFEYVEEVGARVDGRGAAAEHFIGVDVEGLRVEGEGPEVVFARTARGRGRAGEGVGLDFGGAALGGGGCVEVYYA
jgi:hypothetical protein